MERYFVDAVPVAARRGAAVATLVGRFAFPGPVVDGGTLARGEALLASRGLEPALRRQVADHLDDLRRALRVRRPTEGDAERRAVRRNRRDGEA